MGSEHSTRIKRNYEEYYDIVGMIGKESYKTVWKGKDKKTNELRAITVIDLKKVIEDLSYQYKGKELEDQIELNLKGFKEEYENMKICSNNNENSVKCYEYFQNEKNFVIIMELCNTNLSDLLTEKKELEKKIRYLV